MNSSYHSVPELIRKERPKLPVYCIYPETYIRTAAEFVAGFPGRVLYAVKANDHPEVIRLLAEGGVTHFDCASVPEIATVLDNCPQATCYFMIPARLRGAAAEAQAHYGVRHFMVDHTSGIDQLAAEIEFNGAVVFARMAVQHPSALMELSSKFGAPPADIPALIEAIGGRGAEPALAFNVGSAVTSPAAYSHAIEVATAVLDSLLNRLRLVDIGGGFAKSYPGFDVPPISAYFQAITEAASSLSLAPGGEIMCEPGRALAAPGLSAVVEVLQRKESRIYINDGMYGIFWELRFKGHDRYPLRCYRNGQLIDGTTNSFKILGPTCDSTDVLPGEVPLPADLGPGDHIEFGRLGAYSLSGRTRFNGQFSDAIVAITGTDEAPPE